MDPAIPPVVVGVIGLVGAVVTARFGKSGSRENAIIDQLQENVQDLRKELHELRNEMDTLRKAQAADRRILSSAVHFIDMIGVAIQTNRPRSAWPKLPDELTEYVDAALWKVNNAPEG